MRDRSLLVILFAMFGLSGAALLSSAPVPKATSDSPASAAVAPPSSSGPRYSDLDKSKAVYGPLLEFFGVDDVDAAVAQFRLSRSEVIVAMVPDPQDSEVGFSFDQRLETLRLAAVAAGYQPDRFYLPWQAASRRDLGAATPGAPAVPAAATTPLHRTVPGAQLFRGSRRADGSLPLLLVLLVGETPTFGSDRRALGEAFEIAESLLSRDEQGRAELRVIGPTYSGAIEPLRAESIESWVRDPNLRLHILSTASSSAQLEQLAVCDFLPLLVRPKRPASDCLNQVVSFSESTTSINEKLFSKFLRSRAPGEVVIALLHEGDTSYGAALSNESTESKQKLILLPYPLHISQLWAAHLRNGRNTADPSVQLDPSARRALSLFPEAPANPIDVPPSFFPTTAANVADRVLANLLIRLKTKDPDFVGIVGTNVSDLIFLAHLVRDQVPDAQLFTIGSELLATHPQHTRDLHGLWIISSQDSHRSVTMAAGREQWLQLSSSWEAAQYEAFLAAICPLNAQPEELEPCHSRPGPRWSTDRVLSPPGAVVVSAVGRGALWKVATYGDDEEEARSKTKVSFETPRAFALLIAVFVIFGVAVMTIYGVAICFPKVHLDGLRTLDWLGSRNPRESQLSWSTPAFFGSLALAGAYPALLWSAGARELTFSPRDSILLGASVMTATALALLAVLAPLRERGHVSRSQMQILHVLRVLVLFVAPWLLWNVALADADPHNEVLRAARAVQLLSGLSPVVPWSFLAAALVLYSYSSLSRRRLNEALAQVDRFRHGTQQLTVLVDAVREGVGISADPSFRWRRLRGVPVLAAASAVFSTIAMLVRCDPTRPVIITMESQSYAWALTIAFALLFGAAIHLAFGALDLWRRLRRLLRALAWGPLSDAFDRVPKELFRTLGLRSSSAPGAASELRYDIDQLSMVHSLAVRSQAQAVVALKAKLDPDWDATRNRLIGELASQPIAERWVFAHETKAQGVLSERAGKILEFLRDQVWSCEPVDPEAWGGETELEVGKREHLATDVLTQYRVRSLPLLQVAEEFVAVEIVRFLSVVFSHLRTLLMSSIGVILLTLLAAGAYPLRPQALLIRWMLLGFGFVMGIAIVLINQTERNEVLSRIANRTPNRLDLDSTFFAQIFTYLVLPIAALLVTQFPAFGEPLAAMLSALGTR